LPREDKLEKKLRMREYRYEREQRYLRKRSELNEVLEEVFDQQTLMTIYELMNRRLIKEFYGVVSAGKESRIYYAEGGGGEALAVKIYLITSAEFRKTRSMYVLHDPRFQRVPKDFRDFIYLWARREYRNLKDAYEVGVPVPRPYFVRNNVLGMQFMGVDGRGIHCWWRWSWSPMSIPRYIPRLLRLLGGFIRARCWCMVILASITSS